jgi:ribokinase
VAEPGTMFVIGSFVAACSVKVPRLPHPGESLSANAFTIEAGGKGFNVAVGARRLGASVDGVLAIGDDLFSQLAEIALIDAGLPLSMLLRQRGATGAGVGFIDAAGENCLAVFPGANALLSAQDIANAGSRISRARLVFAQYEVGDAPIAAAFDKARREECLTILNPSPYRSIDPRILSNTNILILNRIEAQQLGNDLGIPYAETGGPAYLQQLADRLHGLGTDIVIVTLGADGVLGWRRGYPLLRQEPFRVDVIDTLGAGDAFTAGFATGLLEGRPFEDCLRWGAACGACATTQMGVLNALPTPSALQAALDVTDGAPAISR